MAVGLAEVGRPVRAAARTTNGRSAGERSTHLTERKGMGLEVLVTGCLALIRLESGEKGNP
jgi:hypothetical protein